MRLLLIVMCACFFANCSAIVIENNNGIIKVDKWGDKKTAKRVKARKPGKHEIKQTWMN